MGKPHDAVQIFLSYPHTHDGFLYSLSGLREATEGMIKKKKTKELTPWQEYLQKKEEKKMKKREERKKKSQAGGKVLIWP